MVEYNKKKYELKYNLKRIEMIENITGMPTLGEMRATQGILSISKLKTYFAYGLKEAESETFVSVKEGMKIAEELIIKKGYINVNGLVLEALERDCPFFFQGA